MDAVARPAPEPAMGRGFADPVDQSQRVFRAVMTALSRPATIVALAAGVRPPPPLTPELAAVTLALADHETPVWLDARLTASQEVAAYLRFHAGAPIVEDPAGAAFALTVNAADLPPFGRFALGSDEYPDRSTTIVAAVHTLSDVGTLLVEGPGIAGTRAFAASPLPSDLPARLAGNRAMFPRGIDLVLVADGRVAALPRSTKLVPEG
jgi:alpha-D-ribose 1-methylphosphonate 5-triphosphate synthase subunit PhnH